MNQMAAGLAHEVNQPLCAIASYAEGCLRMLKSNSFDSKELIESMEDVAHQAHRAGDVIKNLREFTNRGDNEHSQEDIHKVILNSVKLVQGLAKQKDIAIQVNVPDKPLLTLIKKVQIEQVILNLISNGIDAMVETEHDKCKILIDISIIDDENIQVSVTDSGLGLSDASIDQIFQPFFTTKKEGMGIGLSITKSIIEDHGGQLWAEQNLQEGATFKFTLPIAGKE
jgi:two-component system, LuxR family, sensor kinase FixL